MNNPAAELYQALGQLSHDHPVLPGMDKMLDKALAAAELIADLRRERNDLFGALTNATTALHVADMATGTCGCGQDMDTHASAYSAGHAPVDEGEHWRLSVLKTCQDALAGVKEIVL